jgi:hypothetical protein
MMAQQDIVAEIRMLREAIDTDARRIFELSQALYRMTRQQPADDSTVPYRNYANAWSRFASMVGLGLRRTNTSDRVLAMLKPEPEPAKPEPVEPEPEVFVPPPEDEDFEEVYGEVLNA